MAFLTTILSGRTLPELQSNIDTFFAANTNARVFSADFVGRDRVGYTGLELTVSLLYDTAGETLATPFTAQAFVAATAAALEAEIDAAVAAAPTDFWAGPLIDYIAQTRRLDVHIGLMFTSADVGASGNWRATARATSFQLGAEDQDGDLFLPTLATLLGGATLSSVAGNAAGGVFQNQVPSIDLATNQDRAGQWTIPIISSTYNGQDIDWTIHWTTDGVDANDALLTLQVTALNVGDVISAEAAPSRQQTVINPSGTASEIQSTTFTLTQAQMDALAAGDQALVAIGRLGSDAADTNGDTLQILGARIALG